MEPIEWAIWVCRQGHRQRQRADAVAVTCGKCARNVTLKGTVECRREDLFPNWPKKPVAA